MFIDVKYLRELVVCCSYFDFLLFVFKGVKFNENWMYLYLFIRSFVRGCDVFFIILRLVIIVIILMVWLL